MALIKGNLKRKNSIEERPCKRFKEKSSSRVLKESKLNEQKQHFECTKCGESFDRRFNMNRHFDRFHCKKTSKSCCNISFDTKGEYYLHQEKKHEMFRYLRKHQEKVEKSKSYNEKVDHNKRRKKTSRSPKSEIAKEPQDYAEVLDECFDNIEAVSKTETEMQQFVSLEQLRVAEKAIESENCAKSKDDASTSSVQVISEISRRKSLPRKKLLSQWHLVPPKKVIIHVYERRRSPCDTEDQSALHIYVGKVNRVKREREMLRDIALSF